MTLRMLFFLVFGILAAAGIALAWLYGWVEDDAGRLLMRRELEKALVQLALVTVIGGIVGFLYKIYESDRQAYEKQREFERQQHLAIVEFQTDKISRLVEIANTMRRAPALIEAHRSAKTYGEQMRAAIDARLELHRIQHEVGLFGLLDDNTVFTSWVVIRSNLQDMQHFLKNLEEEFRDKYKEISELQRAAEKDRKIQAEIWDQICKLPMIRDLLALDTGHVDDTQFYQEFLTGYHNALISMKKAVAENQNLL